VANVRRSGFRRATLLVSAMIVLSACNPTRFVSGWVPYWNATEGRAGFTSAASSMFTDISPFFYSAQADGTIALVGSASALSTTAHEAKIRGIEVLPTITDGSGKLTMATVILADPALRAQHIANIVALTANPEIDGVDLDYEGFAFSDGRDSWAATTPVWRAFIHELADALHAKFKRLAVTIPPVWVAGGVTTGYTVYDQAGIAPYVDRLRLMVYDWSVSSPGPISPMSWLTQVIAYSNAALPGYTNKLQLGVPSYGRDWGRQAYSSETCPDGALSTKSIELQNIPAVVSAHGAQPVRHTSGEMYFTYDLVVTGFSTKPIPPPPYVPPAQRIASIPGAAIGPGGLLPALRLAPPSEPLTCTVRHFVYYPDATTIQQHAQAALDNGWGGVVIWALGYETADVYTNLANTTP
jgi:spore germination protein YaaH